MEIAYKSKNVIVINKPVGVPSESDLSGDKDAMSLTREALSLTGEQDGLYLVHRLDRVVGGALLFARNGRAAAALSEAFRDRRVAKEYLAAVEGELDEPRGVLTDLLYKDSGQGKSFVTDRMRRGVKEATLEYERIAVKDSPSGKLSLLRVTLGTGRHHQIRVQFASRRHPLAGDGKYGSRDHGCRTPALFSSRIEAEFGREEISVRLLPDTELYPWCLFSDEISSLVQSEKSVK